MFEHLKLFLAANLFDLKKRLRLDLAPESKWLIQMVMVYNCLVWTIFTWQARARFRKTLGDTPKRPLSFFTEVYYGFFKTFNQDSDYLELRRQYRVYLGFLLMLYAFTYLIFLPATWTMQLHVRIPPRLLALTQ
jgi:hypothetical protein